MTASSLASLVKSKRTEIIGLFVERVMKDDVAPVPSGMRRSELIDHLPSFLDTIGEALDSAAGALPDANVPSTFASALEHGLQRLRLGFDVQAVVREYGVLRECILTAVSEQNAAISVREFIALSKCIDIGTANAVAEYSKHKHADLERAVKAREDVIAVVSHDLRTPLNAIVMSTHVLASRLSPESHEYKVSEAIARAGDQMARMIGELLTVATIDAGEFVVEASPVSPSVLVEGALATFVASANQRSIRLFADDVDQLPLVLCDKESVQRIFGNIIENALKFTPPSGQIKLSARIEDAFVRFSVSDTGAGVPEEHAPRIFERFYRARDMARSGTGLGLYIARGITEANGGTIGLEKGTDGGAVLWFTLPLAPVERAPLSKDGS